MTYQFRISGKHHIRLSKLLYPGDGLEAGAIATCGRFQIENLTILLVQSVFEIPNEAYVERQDDCLEYRLEWMTDIINYAEARDLSLVRFHSHPSGYSKFSQIDDATDLSILRDWRTWFDRDTPHGSAIMLPNGKVIARVLRANQDLNPIRHVVVAGDRILFWPSQANSNPENRKVAHRNIQSFGEGTIRKLQQMKVAVIGCSGTGSIVVEQLARLGVGHIVIVDPEVLEEKNLNRILNSRQEDASAKRSKVLIAKRAIERMGFNTKVTTIPGNFIQRDIVREVASADVIFGCVDGAEGRHVLNRLATYYLVPYFDVGVALTADGKGGVSEITGAVHYLQPGGSSLLSRGVYTLDEVEAETMHRLQPDLYKERLKQNYIAGIDEDRPTVLPVNMHFASLLVLEFLARLHGYRYIDDNQFSIQQYNLEDPDKIHRAEDGEPCERLKNRVGRGDVCPLLDLQMLTE